MKEKMGEKCKFFVFFRFFSKKLKKFKKIGSGVNDSIKMNIFIFRFLNKFVLTFTTGVVSALDCSLFY